ncbi:MAG: acyltransferase family protein [Silanimonas sp.]|nr:acyltransferase family protein [Silanimonas sp.]
MAPRASMTYRADIDGLRALAVMLVVLAHAGVPGFGGGFFGVDVFFVISGFLITGLLVDEFRTTGRFDAARFYERRVRRLLPAFAIVMATTLALAAILLSPAELARHAKEASWAAAWMANIHQVWSDTSYFGETRESGLFLHAWSLSVEEQFYLLWPILLLAAWRLARGASGLRRFVPLATVLAFAWGVWRAHIDPLSAYFLPDARAWQLMLGACAFLWVDTRRPSGSGRWFGVLGLILVVSAAVGFDKSSGNLMLLAALPAFGAALLLVAGAGGVGRVTSALGSRWPVAVGRVSYGWYLWHWPALIFAALLAPDNLLVRALAVLGSFAAAVGMYHWLERPIRKRSADRPSRVVLAGAMGSIALALLALWISRVTVQPEEGGHAALHPIQALAVAPEYNHYGCDDWYRSSELRPCFVPPQTAGAPTVIVTGDSIGLQFFPAFRQIFAARGWNLIIVTKSACPMVDRPFYYARIGREFTECSQWRASVAEFIRDFDPNLVLVGSAGDYPFDAEQWRSGTEDFLRSIAGEGREVILLGPTPMLPFDGLQCLMRHHHEAPDAVDSPECSVTLVDAEWRGVNGALRAAVEAVPDTRFVDLSALPCPEGVCSAWNRGQLAFRDSQHLNPPFALTLAPELEQLLDIQEALESSQ